MHREHDHDDHPDHDNHTEPGGDGHGGWWPRYIAHHGEGHFHYMRNQLIVTDEELARVERLLEGRVRIEGRREDQRLGLLLLELNEYDIQRQPVPNLVEELHADWEQEVVPQAVPNHVFGPCSHLHLNGSSPEPTDWQPGTLPPIEQPGQPGAGVTVALLDTGFDEDQDDSWFGGRVSGDPEAPITDRFGRLLPNAGHGTFVAGVVVRHAPGARVVVKRVFNDDGIVDDWTAATTLADLADEKEPVHIVNMSLGAYARRDRGMLACERSIGYAKFRRPELVLIAAAGNERQDRPCFPAADKRVIGVASVEQLSPERWRRARFSNYGWWVDACAPGVDIHSTFLDYEGPVVPFHEHDLEEEFEQDDLQDECGAMLPDAGELKQLTFRRTARWSGTSFSAPLVAAAIARRAAEELTVGQTAPTALATAVGDVVAEPHRRRLHNLGTLVNPEPYV
jgi:subtilisin family serine protease